MPTNGTLLAAGIIAALVLSAAAAFIFVRTSDRAPKENSAVPNFGAMGYGWFEIGDDFLPPAAGPGPVPSGFPGSLGRSPLRGEQ